MRAKSAASAEAEKADRIRYCGEAGPAGARVRRYRTASPNMDKEASIASRQLSRLINYLLNQEDNMKGL